MTNQNDGVVYNPKFLNYRNLALCAFVIITLIRSQELDITVIVLITILIYSLVYIHYWDFKIFKKEIIYQGDIFEIVKYYHSISSGKYSERYISISSKNKKFKIYESCCKNFDEIILYLELNNVEIDFHGENLQNSWLKSTWNASLVMIVIIAVLAVGIIIYKLLGY